MIAIVNESTVCTDDEIKGYLPALQIQLTRDFGPAWGFSTTLQFFAKGDPAAAAHWQIVVLDNADQAGALGYHDLTAADLPLGKVFAATDKQYGNSVSVTLSHELLEMLGDPKINMTTTVSDANGNLARLYAYEACDPCEADSLGYPINGVLVSDFILPRWFDPASKASYFDFMHHITLPLQLLPGGYASVWTPTGGWSQLTNGEHHYSQIPQVGSRRERRARGRGLWLRSHDRTSSDQTNP